MIDKKYKKISQILLNNNVDIEKGIYLVAFSEKDGLFNYFYSFDCEKLSNNYTSLLSDIHYQIGFLSHEKYYEDVYIVTCLEYLHIMHKNNCIICVYDSVNGNNIFGKEIILLDDIQDCVSDLNLSKNIALKFKIYGEFYGQLDTSLVGRIEFSEDKKTIYITTKEGNLNRIQTKGFEMV